MADDPTTTAATQRLIWTDGEGTTWGEPIDIAAQRERQGRVTVEAAEHPDGSRAVIARCARCGADLSGANDGLSLAFLLDVGSGHDCA